MNNDVFNKLPVERLTQADLIDSLSRKAFHQIRMEDQELIAKRNRKRRKIKAIQEASKKRNIPVKH